LRRISDLLARLLLPLIVTYNLHFRHMSEARLYQDRPQTDQVSSIFGRCEIEFLELLCLSCFNLILSVANHDVLCFDLQHPMQILECKILLIG
jgi:hypothetical protein